MKRFVYLILFGLLVASCSASSTSEPTSPVPTATTARTEPSMTAKFTPPPGQTLLLVGQDLDAVANYVREVNGYPSGITTYTSITEGSGRDLLNGLTQTVDYGAGLVNGQLSVDDYPNTVLAIGLELVDHTGENLLHIIDGTHDEYVDALGEFIAASQRPVFLRIGYEFDGQWNHYEPELYKSAFRYIVERLRANGVDNFVSVWQSATYMLGTYQNRPITDWYPGDDVVDWMGTSFFVFDQSIHDASLDFARLHEKPVMIAEAAPQGYELDELTYASPFSGGLNPADRTWEEIWEEWFAPFFSYIHENSDVIRAVAYINVDWNSQPMWERGANNGYWGDTRIEANSQIRASWLEEIESEFWLLSDEDLYQKLGFAP